MAKGKGRPRTPTATLKLNGDFREDRHGTRADEVVRSGKPRKPRGLKPKAATAWKHLVEATPDGIYGEQDTEMLTAYAKLWAHYEELDRQGDIAGATKVLQTWLRVATDLGVGPISRCKLAVEKAENKQQALKDFLAG